MIRSLTNTKLISREFLSLQHVRMQCESPGGNILPSEFPTQSFINVLENRTQQLFLRQLENQSSKKHILGDSWYNGYSSLIRKNKRSIQHSPQSLWNQQNWVVLLQNSPLPSSHPPKNDFSYNLALQNQILLKYSTQFRLALVNLGHFEWFENHNIIFYQLMNGCKSGTFNCQAPRNQLLITKEQQVEIKKSIAKGTNSQVTIHIAYVLKKPNLLLSISFGRMNWWFFLNLLTTNFLTCYKSYI